MQSFLPRRALANATGLVTTFVVGAVIYALVTLDPAYACLRAGLLILDAAIVIPCYSPRSTASHTGNVEFRCGNARRHRPRRQAA